MSQTILPTFLCNNKHVIKRTYDATSEKQKTLHYSLPYTGHFSHVTKKKLRYICERFCKDIDIKIAF